MTIHNDPHRFEKQFEEMLVAYFNELDSGIPEGILKEKLFPYVLRLYQQEIIHIALLVRNELPAGFAIYQIDTPRSDWCKKEGWGCIREFFIAESHRRQGYGRKLAAYSENHLRKLGATQIYLTGDTAISFWQHCGFCTTGEICSNGLEIMCK